MSYFMCAKHCMLCQDVLYCQPFYHSRVLLSFNPQLFNYHRTGSGDKAIPEQALKTCGCLEEIKRCRELVHQITSSDLPDTATAPAQPWPFPGDLSFSRYSQSLRLSVWNWIIKFSSHRDSKSLELSIWAQIQVPFLLSLQFLLLVSHIPAYLMVLWLPKHYSTPFLFLRLTLCSVSSQYFRIFIIRLAYILVYALSLICGIDFSQTWSGLFWG